MAEEIRRRVAALRLAALLAVAMTIAGLTTREPVQPVAGESIPKDSVGTRQVIDNSLTAEDFRAGELLTPGQAGNKFLKIDAAQETYLNKVDAADTYLDKVRAADIYLDKVRAADVYLQKVAAADTFLDKVEAATTYLNKVEAANVYLQKVDAADTYLSKFRAADLYLSKVEAASEYLLKVDAGDFLHKQLAADTYLSKIDAASQYLLKIDAQDFLQKSYADATYLKQDAQVDAWKLGGLTADQFVQGDGSVLTGLVLMDKAEPQPLMDLPGLGRLLAIDKGEAVSASFENLSGGPLLMTYDGTSETVPDKGTTGILIGLDQPTLVQMVSPESGLVSTVTLSVAMFGDTPLLSGQALVGR